MSATDAIGSLATGSYTVTRHAAGTRVQGRSVPGAVSTFSIIASVQPVTGRQLQDLPEGQRGTETIAIYTRTELKTRSADSEPDLVDNEGVPFEVVRVERWRAFSDVHYRAYAMRTERP